MPKMHDAHLTPLAVCRRVCNLRSTWTDNLEVPPTLLKVIALNI
jgi:hypothetical protein